MRNLAILCIVLFLHNHIYSQSNDFDSSALISITIIEKGNANLDYFPNVYPSIHEIYIFLIDSAFNRDTVKCIYNFPFLLSSKRDFVETNRYKKAIMSFYYDYIDNKVNNRYLISIPLKVPLSNSDMLFIVIEKNKKNKFSQMQRYKGSTFMEERVESILIY